MKRITAEEGERRRGVYEEAANDLEAAASLGITYQAFRLWRIKQGLPIKRAKVVRVPQREHRRREEVWSMTESDEEAAAFLGIHSRTFREWRERRGLVNKWNGRMPGTGNNVTPTEERRRLAAWASSKSLREAAARLGLAEGTYGQWAKSRGIPPPGAAMANPRIGLSEHETRLWDAYCTSFSDRESAVRVGVGRQSVRRWRARNQLPGHKQVAEFWHRLRQEALLGNPVAAFHVRRRFPRTHGLDQAGQV